MKRRILSLVLLLALILASIPTIGIATPIASIDFPDPNFEEAVRLIIEKPIGEITQSDVAEIVRLHLYGRSIISLSGIEYFTALTELLVYNNELTELDVSKNNLLTVLNVADNQLVKIDVNDNSLLEYLNCYNNQLSGIDLSKNAKLEYLECSSNQLTELDVTNNVALTHLFCNNNQLKALDISSNSLLECLECGDNDLPNKAAIIGIVEIRTSMVFFPQRAFVPNMDTISQWAKAEIDNALGKGFVPQDIQENFAAVITRQEFCRMAVMFVEYALGKDIDDILTEKSLSRDYYAFYDTPDPYILAAYALGITNGTRAPTETSSGLFTPDGQFSRQEAATMLMRICRVIGMDTNNPPVSDFTDMSEASAWAYDGINLVRANGIMNGTSATMMTFSPRGLYTRQESIVSFNRI
jgi:hypothetical protein